MPQALYNLKIISLLVFKESRMSQKPSSPIGVFDSGYGGLTILKELVKTLPEYDYLYLGEMRALLMVHVLTIRFINSP